MRLGCFPEAKSGLIVANPGGRPNTEAPRELRDSNQRNGAGNQEEDVMTRYTGGSKVEGGYYWNPRTWEVKLVGAEGAILPGSERASFVRVPFPVLFAVVPIMGALFLMFLPLIGFALLGYSLVKRAAGGVKEGAEDLAASVTPGWAPGAAHFTGKAGEEKKGEAEAKSAPELEKLAKEIEEKRK
jgi:hypothetical protein